MSEASTQPVKKRDPSALPRRVGVGKVVSSRYSKDARPTSWDERSEGIDVIETPSGEAIRLWSNGGQSCPSPGWELLLTRRHNGENQVFEWTLYGIPHRASSSQLV